MVNLSFIQHYTSKKIIPKNSEAALESTERLTHLYLHNKYIDEIGNLDACKNLQVLYLHNNTVRKIKNLHTLVSLKHLYLQKNKINQIEALGNLQELRKLYLGYNQISVIEKLESLSKLEELHVEKQELNKGEELCFDPRTMMCLENLQVLNISCNNLKSINDLLPLRQLKVLKATHNKISDFVETAKVLGCLYYLLEADFTGNPMTKLHRYRETIIANTFRLSILDMKDINETTRDFIKRFEFEKSQQKQSRERKIEPDISGDVAPPVKKQISKSLFKNIHESLSNSLLTTAMSEETTAYIPWNALKKSAFTSVMSTMAAKPVEKEKFVEKPLEKKVQFTTILPQLYE